MISDYVKSFKLWLKTKSLMQQDTVVGGVKAATAQEDVRDTKAKKNTNEAFDEQAQAIATMALKSHRIDCDIVSCKSDKCFIREPDKIVLSTTVKIPKARRVNASMGRYEKK